MACGAWDEIGVEDGNVLGGDLSKFRVRVRVRVRVRAVTCPRRGSNV